MQRLPETSLFQGDFGEQWVQTAAAASGVLHGRPTTLDFEKADVELVLPGVFGGLVNPTVKAQVKTIVAPRIVNGGRDLSFGLDRATYDVLRSSHHVVARVLIVVGLTDHEGWLRVAPEGTLLVGRAAWVSLEGHPATANRSVRTVHLPLANTVDREGLTRMLLTHGARSSSRVPDVDPWSRA